MRSAMMLANQVISAVMQVGIILLISFIVYFLSKKNIKGFFAWIGLKKFTGHIMQYAIVIFFLFFTALLVPYMYMFKAGFLEQNLSNSFVFQSFEQTGIGFQTMLIILIWAIVQTSLSEELLFRGLIGKLLMQKFSYSTGNIIQAILFGLIHVPGVYQYGMLPILFTFIPITCLGYALGWLSNKKCSGSILAGWGIHAMANIVSPLIVCIFLFD